jgi:hypothetical protein
VSKGVKLSTKRGTIWVKKCQIKRNKGAEKRNNGALCVKLSTTRYEKRNKVTIRGEVLKKGAKKRNKGDKKRNKVV